MHEELNPDERQYTYIFSWPGVDRYVVYANELKVAKDKFREETGFDPDGKDVDITRQEPGTSRKTKPFD